MPNHLRTKPRSPLYWRLNSLKKWSSLAWLMSWTSIWARRKSSPTVTPRSTYVVGKLCKAGIVLVAISVNAARFSRGLLWEICSCSFWTKSRDWRSRELSCIPIPEFSAWVVQSKWGKLEDACVLNEFLACFKSLLNRIAKGRGTSSHRTSPHA